MWRQAVTGSVMVTARSAVAGSGHEATASGDAAWFEGSRYRGANGCTAAGEMSPKERGGASTGTRPCWLTIGVLSSGHPALPRGPRRACEGEDRHRQDAGLPLTHGGTHPARQARQNPWCGPPLSAAPALAALTCERNCLACLQTPRGERSAAAVIPRLAPCALTGRCADCIACTGDGGSMRVRALIISSTRELATQV